MLIGYYGKLFANLPKQLLIYILAIILTSRTTAFSEELSFGVCLENNNRTAKKIQINDTSQQPCCYFDRCIETNERLCFLVKQNKTASSTLINFKLGSITVPIECNVEKDTVLLTLLFSENGLRYQIDSGKERKLRANVPKKSHLGLQFLEHTITVECVLPVTAGEIFFFLSHLMSDNCEL